MTRLAVECRFAPCSETEFHAVRHGLEVVDADGTWRESFAAGAWLVGGRGARVTLAHDGLDVGQVVCAVARGAWHYADLDIEASDPSVLDHVRVGRPVSIDARSIKREDDDSLGLRRHTLAQLQAIAILNPGQVPWYADAKITRVKEMPARELDAPGETPGVIRRECGSIVGVR